MKFVNGQLSYLTCSVCGGYLLSGRRDKTLCSPKCKQKAYRQRLEIAALTRRKKAKKAPKAVAKKKRKR